MKIRKEELSLILNFISIFIIIFMSPLLNGKILLGFVIFQIMIGIVSNSFKELKVFDLVILFYLIILFILYILINGMNYFQAMFTIFQLIILLFVTFINYRSLFNRIDINRVINYICILGFIISMYSIYEYITQSNPIFIRLFSDKYFDIYSNLNNNLFYNNTGRYRISSSFEHPIIASSVAMFLAYISLWGYIINKKAKYLMCLFTNIIMLYVTFSRSMYISLGIGLFLFLLINIYIRRKNSSMKKYIKYIFILLISLGMLIIIISIPINGKQSLMMSIIERFMQLYSNDDKGSLYLRMYSIQYILNEFRNSTSLFYIFFGHGIGTLSYYLSSNDIVIYATGYYIIDNQYFTSLYEIGIVNLSLIFMMLLKNIIKYFVSLQRKSNNKYIYEYSISILMITSFFISFFMFDGLTWVVIIYLLSISLALLKKSELELNLK